MAPGDGFELAAAAEPARVNVRNVPESACRTGGGPWSSELANSEFFGMWRDHPDIADSFQFSPEVRFRGWRRPLNGSHRYRRFGRVPLGIRGCAELARKHADRSVCNSPSLPSVK